MYVYKCVCVRAQQQASIEAENDNREGVGELFFVLNIALQQHTYRTNHYETYTCVCVCTQGMLVQVNEISRKRNEEEKKEK